MADEKRSQAQGTSACCEVAWLKRRRELEDMPMTRVDARQEEESCPERGCGCGCGCAPVCWGQLVELAQEQNQLLYDLLGAVNCLAATQLAAAQRGK